jgi:predicted aspartyl protease
MGDVYVEVELVNYQDRVLVEHGYREAASIRQERVRVLADSGATLLVLPQDLVERLGLRITDRKVIVTYADERKDERPVAGVLTIRVGERDMETECVVGPPRSEPLLGQIILERLDLLVDCAQGRLVPRPESPYLPLLKLK